MSQRVSRHERNAVQNHDLSIGTAITPPPEPKKPFRSPTTQPVNAIFVFSDTISPPCFLHILSADDSIIYKKPLRNDPQRQIDAIVSERDQPFTPPIVTPLMMNLERNI